MDKITYSEPTLNMQGIKEVIVTHKHKGDSSIELIAGLPWKWYFECSVVCRDQQGKEYIVSETVHCESAYRQSDPRLNEFLNKHHKAFLAKQNNLHVITLAWVAVPAIGEKVDLEIETLDKIYTKLGAFEYLSTWENNQLEDAA